MQSMDKISSVTAVLAAWLVSWGGMVSADIYKYEDRDGHIHLTDKPMKHGQYRLLKHYRTSSRKRSRTGGDSLAALQRRRKALAPMIDAAARAERLRPELVHAVVRVESAYRTDAVSSKGARGLMQLMPETARELGVSDPHDPRQNLRGGTRYLRRLLERFDNDLKLALAAYNAGETAVAQYGNKVPPFPETQDYVKKVLRFYKANRASAQLAQR